MKEKPPSLSKLEKEVLKLNEERKQELRDKKFYNRVIKRVKELYVRGIQHIRAITKRIRG